MKWDKLQVSSSLALECDMEIISAAYSVLELVVLCTDTFQFSGHNTVGAGDFRTAFQA